MIEIDNQEPTPTKLAYYKKLPAGGLTYDFVRILPGLNLIPAADMEKVGFGTSKFPYSHIEQTKVDALPLSAAVSLAQRSVATDALEVWLMTEKRPAVREVLRSKTAQRAEALEASEGLIEEPGEDEIPDGFGI